MSASQFMVEVDDDGISPSGKPDECFYCGQKIGQPHKSECVIICVNAEYEVLAFGQVVGMVTLEDPAHWDDRLANVHKNELIWCVDNCVDNIQWTDSDSGRLAKKKLDEIYSVVDDDGDSDCACGFLELNRVSVSEPFKSRG